MNPLPLIVAAGTLAALCPLPSAGAEPAASYAEAKARIGADGCIFFACADGWDAFSRQRCEELMAHPAIQEAAGAAPLILLPIPEQADEARKKKQQELCGGLQVPDAHSYPALIFMDSKGRHYATLCGGSVSRGNPTELAPVVARRLAGGRERARLLAEAETQQGPAKAATLFRAYRIEGLSWPGKGFSGQLAKLDPGDDSGVRRAWDFNAYDFAGRIDGMELSAALAEVEKLLADKAYSDRQKQQACAAALGVLRRKGGAETAAAFRRYSELLQSYAPHTPEGLAAPYVQSEWAPGLRYGKGWSPSSLTLGEKPTEMAGPLPIREPGTYTVTFTYTHGRWALVILAAELYDGSTKVAEDRHKGSAGNRHHANTYTLRVDKPVREPHLFITTSMNERDSAGNITIRRQ